MITGIAGGTGGIGGLSAGDCTAFTGAMKDVSGTGPNTMNYTLACAAPGAGPYTGQGFGAGKAVSVVLNGTITPLEFQNAFAGAYRDVVTVTVTY
jgi:spore coat protein U-like protein